VRCFVGFFGLTRSVKQTAESIRTSFYAPLAAAGIKARRVGHFNLPEVIDNPRSDESAIIPDRNESMLLDLELSWIEPQDDLVIATELEVGRAFPDAFGDQYRSLANLCHQLHSLRRLWSLLELLGVSADDIVLLLRPDLLYIDVLEPVSQLQPLVDGRVDLIVPRWQSWCGLNDRFAFCTGRAARVYASRIECFAEGCVSLGTMHGESFLKFLVRDHNLRVGLTDLRAARLRANGQIPANDLGMFSLDPEALSKAGMQPRPSPRAPGANAFSCSEDLPQ
jgi:hypothetical protein